MALDANEGIQTALELLNLAVSAAQTARALPAGTSEVKVAAAILRAHGNQIADLAERIEDRVTS